MNYQVYLAGKVTKNGWRESICSHRDVITADADDTELYHWPEISSIVQGVSITGPYNIGCDHGCFHGNNTHGFGDVTCYTGDGVIRRSRVVQSCLDAIRRSTSIFAWIDARDCFGTLLELGYAQALKKDILVAVSPSIMVGYESTEYGTLGHHDMWFLEQMADRFGVFNTASEAFIAFFDN